VRIKRSFLLIFLTVNRMKADPKIAPIIYPETNNPSKNEFSIYRTIFIV
jgi:hypothetical protein